MCTLINQTADGGLIGAPLEETYAIVEKAAQDYHLWMSDRGNPKDKKGVHDLYLADDTNDIAELTNTVKMLATEIKNLKTDSAMMTFDVANVGVYCQISGSPSHFADGCQPRGQYNNQAQQTQNNASYQPRPQFNNKSQGQQTQNSGPSSNLESLLTNFLAKQDKWNQYQERRLVEQDRRLQGVEQSLEQLAIQNRMLETQVAQQANLPNRERGKLPSKLDPNPRESVNAITLRGGKQLEMLPAHSARSPASKSVTDSTPADEEMPREAENRAENSAQTVEPAPYRPPIPFPQWLVAKRRDKEFQ
ncbi:unnamed protein product [Rhodiola kirilowii]